MATAGTGHRGMLVAYPLLVLALAGPAAMRRRARAASPAGAIGMHREARGAAGSPRWRWGLAIVASLALLYACLPYYASTPVPGRDKAISHYPDLEEHLSIASEAKHHWPIEEPSVSGEAKPYHLFAYMHLAAASQITGLGLPLIFFRFYLAPLVLLAVLALAVAGRALAGLWAVGVAAAALFVFVGEIDLDPGTHQGFASLIPFNGFGLYTLFSPSAPFFGLALFVPLLIALIERLDADRDAGAPRAPWVVCPDTDLRLLGRQDLGSCLC